MNEVLYCYYLKNTVIGCFNIDWRSAFIFVVFYVGSGGNNHAVDYYKETSYPLAVKLGTITPDGAGNQMVIHFEVTDDSFQFFFNSYPSFKDQYVHVQPL